MATKKTTTKKTATKATATKATATKATATRQTASRKKKISQELIRERAREIYEERMAKGIQGNSDSDWLQAEKELKEKEGT
jgi:hypothetical protein